MEEKIFFIIIPLPNYLEKITVSKMSFNLLERNDLIALCCVFDKNRDIEKS